MIGKLTFDKSNMNISYFLYTIKIIDSNNGKISRGDFVKKMAAFGGITAVLDDGKENRTPYNKSKFPRYFGFVDVVTSNPESDYLVLTHRGKILAKYINDNGEDKDAEKRYSIASKFKTNFIDLIFDSIIFCSFGKNNCGAERSNTDVEPPKVVFKTIYELEKASAEEIYYVMFGLNNGVFSDFDEAIDTIKKNRLNMVHDYSKVMKDWGLENKVDDSKIIDIFTDSNISLLTVENDIENNKEYYRFSSVLSESHKEQIRRISAVYEPLRMFAYTNGNLKTIENWVDETILGGVSDNSQVIKYMFGSDLELFCADDTASNFVPGVFEKAILTAFQNEKKNIYLVVHNITEASFFSAMGKYVKLFNRLEDLKDDWHGWSKVPLKDEKLYLWLTTQNKRARSILKNNEVILPSNLHIVGTVIMDNENKDIEFDYGFRRCLIDFDNDIVPTDKNIDEATRLDKGTNVLLYGVPGSGKSWTIEHEYCDKDTNVERVVFHPDYTYSDFIGQILPNVDDKGQVRYEFTPGPFTNILADAYANPKKKYILVIEEINRGNAPAIFGEVFQLLDRKKEVKENDAGYPIGTSEYGITNANIAEIVYGKKNQEIRIPSNLSIIGTMNTSDQNVFTLDTAFQRRWEMRLIENSFKHVDKTFAETEILDTRITWKAFCTQINKIIIGNNARLTSSEDKRLGVYFIHMNDLEYNSKMGNLNSGEYDDLCSKEREKTITQSQKVRLEEIRAAMRQNRKFPEKVIKYLWDDAFKFNREIVFKTSEYQSLEEVIHKFMYSENIERFDIFNDNVKAAFFNPQS